MDVTGLMRRTVGFNRERLCIVHGDRRLTFAQAWSRGCRMANALIDAGIEPGDRVGVLEDNSVEAADFFLGASIAGAVRVPLYPRNRIESHRHMLEHTQCKVLVVSDAHAADIDGLESLPDLTRIIVRDSAYESWLATFPDTDPHIPCDPDDNYIIRHTGGTTGQSKGVAYTHRSWLAAGRDWFYLFPPVLPGDKTLHVGPISHGSGYFFVPTFLAGAANIVLDRFDPEEVLDLMENEGITLAFMVPTMLNAIARHPGAGDRDWSQLKCLQIGGAPITDDTALAARAVFGDVLYQGYGQTEAVPVTMMGPAEWFAEIEGSEPLRSAGRPLPFADLDIVDDGGASLPIGEEGEIAIRCDGQMSGFWANPEATSARMRDGWVLTGDIGRLDHNGYLYVVDRKDDMIISGGYNIWPAEIENVLTGHPAVVEAAAFGVPSDQWGESPAARVTVAEGAAVTEEELIRLVAVELGSYKKPVVVEVTTDALPKSPVGKLLRKQMREPYWEGLDRRVAGN